MSTSNTTNGVNFFPGSRHTHFENCNFVSGSVGSITPQTTPFDPENVIYAEVAPNAILNAGGRADEVRCYPGTREEVISKAEDWMVSGYRDDRRILWLSGPAGAGKSAIVQTLAENGIQRKALMASFFFFRSDPSRAHSRPVVATLLYQLFELLPAVHSIVIAVIKRDRLIFKKSIRDQFMKLIDGPIRSLYRNLLEEPPIVLLIDGLDECDSRPDLDMVTMSEQRALLDVLHELVTLPDPPFIALVASRVESHIEMSFNRIGCSQRSIFLDEDYQPREDIRLYLVGEFSRIKHTHPLGPYLGLSWPSQPVIEALVDKSSGQFIYAATVVRFISNSSDSPGITIEMILNIRPAANNTPFADIDAIYTFILSRCRYWEYARNFLAMDSIVRPTFDDRIFYAQFQHTEEEVRSFFADMKSILSVDLNSGSLTLQYYHASFNDFLYSSSRAGDFFIDVPSLCNSLAPRLLLRISDDGTSEQAEDVLKRVSRRSKLLTFAILFLLSKPVPSGWRYWKDWFPATMKKLYFRKNVLAYKQILHGLRNWYRPPLKRRDPKRVNLRRSERPELKRKMTTYMETCSRMFPLLCGAHLCRRPAPFRPRKKKLKL